MTDSRITLPDWYQFDVEIKGITSRPTLQEIVKIIDILKSQNLIEKWFFLYENSTIRIRLKSENSKELEEAVKDLTAKQNLSISPVLQFQTYWEDIATFPNLPMLEAFANIMSEITELTIKKLQRQITYSNFTLVERLSHCIFDNVYGTDTEGYFLLKRLKVNFNDEDNPEQTILDDKISWKTLQSVTLNLSGIKIPTKHKEK